MTPGQIAEALIHSARDIVARHVRAQADDVEGPMTSLAWNMALAVDEYLGNTDLQRVLLREAYICPTCHRVSYHPKDLEMGWCGACKRFEEAP